MDLGRSKLLTRVSNLKFWVLKLSTSRQEAAVLAGSETRPS